LLDEGRVARHKTSRRELDDLRSAVERNLRDAAVPAVSADTRFFLAYEAALLLAKMAIACSGYRVKGHGAHQTTFTALKLVLGHGFAKTASYFDFCRRKRNELSYDAADVVTEAEVSEILAKTHSLKTTIEGWIQENCPDWA
jgi:hypothetical protein